MADGTVGEYDYTFEPEQPNGFEEVRARIDSPDGCYRGFAFTKVFIEERRLEFYMARSDTEHPTCPAFTPVYKSFGVIPRGTYDMVVYSCATNPVPGVPFCLVHDTTQLFVGGGDPIAVPAMHEIAGGGRSSPSFCCGRWRICAVANLRGMC
jgi:hypothetical protein